MCLVLILMLMLFNIDVLCRTVETNAGDDCQDAGPDAEAGRWRGRRPPCVKRLW